MEEKHIAKIEDSVLSLRGDFLILRWESSGCSILVDHPLEKSIPEMWVRETLQKLFFQRYLWQDPAFTCANAAYKLTVAAIKEKRSSERTS